MRDFLTEKGFAVKKVDNKVAFVIVPSSEQKQADDPNEPPEPSEQGSGDEGEKDAVHIMVEVEYLNEFHLFTIFTETMKVLDLKFVLHGWFGIPWFRMELHHWTDILDDEDILLSYMPEEDNEGTFTQVQLFVNEVNDVTNSMQATLVKQFGDRGRHTVVLSKDFSFQDNMSYLRYFMSGQLDMDPSDLTLFYHYDDTFEHYPDEVVVNVSIAGKGGGDKKSSSVSVRKSNLKTKGEALQRLKQNVEKVFRPSEDDDVPNDRLPPSFLLFISEMNDKFSEFLGLKSRCGDAFITMGLRQMSDTDLKYLDTLFAPKRGFGKNLTVEEKMLKALEAIYPPLLSVVLAQKKLDHTRQDIIHSLMLEIAMSFHQYQEQAGSIALDGSLFHKTVEKEISRRQLSSQPDVNESSFQNCVSQ